LAKCQNLPNLAKKFPDFMRLASEEFGKFRRFLAVLEKNQIWTVLAK
jgi:hypothetical protein